MEHAERVAALSGLLECSEASAEALASAMSHREFPRKSVLCHQGDLNENLWLILDGTIQLQTISVEGQVSIISSFGPGELVGAFPDENELGFDLLTADRAQTLQIGARALTKLLDDCPDLGAGLATIFAGQLDTVLDRLSARVSLTANGRFCRELMKAAEGNDTIAPPPVISALALKAQTTRETGSRTIRKLIKRGIIDRTPERLLIRSSRMLEEMIV